MSFLDHPSRTHLAQRLAGAVHRFGKRLEDYRRTRSERARTYVELNASSDRDLAELGYSREDLIAIARGTYQR
jgi:uncharacterized protein YjiS (DUF1127 family)